MPKPNFGEFTYQGTNDQLAINSVLNGRQRIYAPSGYVEEAREQRLATFLSTPTWLDGDEVIVRLTEWSDDNGRPEGAIFDALIAESTGHRVISANLPGVDYYSGSNEKNDQKLTLEQFADLQSGSFKKTGSAVMKAVQNASIALGSPQGYILLGSCMGGALSAGAMDIIRDEAIDVKGLTFAEPINTVERSFTQLNLQFVTQTNSPGYAAMNPSILRIAAENLVNGSARVYDAKTANLAYGKAIAKGSFLSDMGSVNHLRDIPIFMTRAGASKLSPKDGFDSAVRYLQTAADVETKIYGNTTTNPHDHPYALTVQSYISAAQNVIDRLKNSPS